jgi:hypothetical protein
MSVGTQVAANPKLPLWNTICRAYSTYFNHPLDVLRISWLWLAVAALSSWMQRSWVSDLLAVAKPGMCPQMPAGASALLGVGNLLLLLGLVSIAVAWHRRVILDELPWLSGSNIITKSLWRYIGVGILISLTAVLPVVLFLLVLFVFLLPFTSGGASAHSGVAAIILVPTMLLVYLASMAVMLRLSPLLPARAVGDFGRTFKETWRQTRGNTWRIFWGLLACTLPVMIVVQIAIWRVIGFPNPQMLADGNLGPRLALINTVGMFCYLLMWPIAIGFLSLSYQFFFQREQVGVFD